jgi:hypothetical protein
MERFMDHTKQRYLRGVFPPLEGEGLKGDNIKKGGHTLKLTNLNGKK